MNPGLHPSKEIKSSKTLTAISLFTGAGGLDLGFEAAGFSTINCFEWDPYARATLSANRPDWGLDPTGDVVAAVADLEKRFEPQSVDLVLAGPPCQPFSRSAAWLTSAKRGMKDPRAGTIAATMKWIEALLPRAFVIENVPGFLSSDSALNQIKRNLHSTNKKHRTAYSLNVLTLDATSYGVPQSRRRLFLVGFRDGAPFVPPLAYNSELGGGVHAQQRKATSWDAIGGLATSAEDVEMLTPRGRWADLIATIPEGENYLFHTRRGAGWPIFGYRTRFWSFLLKLAKNKPAWTVQASPGPATGPFHWDNRLLSIAELKALQTFPKNWNFGEQYGVARRQIGNAVPPAMAEAVAWRVRNILEGGQIPETLSMGTVLRDDCPKPSKPKRLPAKYKITAGVLADHPGEGLGPGARKIKRRKSD